ncbi:hypothetical protein GY45DRAFT_1257774, partial [Cubamyces sp. BRFM 1775]
RAPDCQDWHHRIRARSFVYEKPVREYLRTFLPCKVPCNLKPPHRALVQDWQATAPPATLTRDTVQDLPKERRPLFNDLDKKPIPFPFSPFSKWHRASEPDVVMSFPGPGQNGTPSLSDGWNSSNIAMNVSISLVDPFGKRTECTADAQDSALCWLTINSRNLMLAHGLLAAYSLIFFRGSVRIVRFDHVCLLASQPISLLQADGVKTFREFFWRLVHPWEGKAGSITGCDPTLQKMSATDEVWLRRQLGDEAQKLLHGVNLSDGRLAKVWDDGDDARLPKTFLLFKLIDVGVRLFSRNTMVWLGIEDTRTGDPAVDNLARERPVLRVIKDAWNPVGTAAELKCYDRLEATIPEDEWEGLPKRLHGGDLGERDVRRWNAAHEERTHVRFVVDVVGRSIRDFTTTKELVAAFRDAIRGHRLAMRYGGILHRDISCGNILIVDRPIPGRPETKGVLHDFDMSWILSDPPPAGSRLDESNAIAAQVVKLEPNANNVKNLKDAHGTSAFFALDVLRGICVQDYTRRTFQQDLESFYWVLLYVVLEFAAYSDSLDAYRPWRELYYGRCKTMAEAKEQWLLRAPERLTIDDNGPLTALMASFAKLVAQASYSRQSGKKRKPLKYDTVLALFDEALARDDWPVNDRAIRYDRRPPKPPVQKPKAESSNVVEPPASIAGEAPCDNQLKRPREDDEDVEIVDKPSAAAVAAPGEGGTSPSEETRSPKSRRTKRPRLQEGSAGGVPAAK